MSSGRLREVKTMENYKIVRSKGVRGRSWEVVIFERGLFTWREEDPGTRKIPKNADPFQHYLFFSPLYSVYMQVVLVPRTRIFLAERWKNIVPGRSLHLGQTEQKWRQIVQGVISIFNFFSTVNHKDRNFYM